MYCHSWLGIVPLFPPPPVRGATTSKTRRVVVWWPFESVALSRMIDPAHVRAGYGGFVPALPPRVKNRSHAKPSVEMPLYFICSNNAQDEAAQYHAEIA